MDFAVAPPIEETLVAVVRSGDLGYAHARSSGLPEAFAGFAERRWNWAPDPAGVVAVPDVMVGVAELLRVLTPEGAGVVINPPVYPPFFSIIAETGRHVVEVPLADGRLPLDGMRAALRAGASAVLLCNPQNPTGDVWSADDVRAVGRIAAEHDALLPVRRNPCPFDHARGAARPGGRRRPRTRSSSRPRRRRGTFRG